jgi:hypothetical protein
MKSFILASALALTPTQSAETHLLGNLDLPVPAVEVVVEEPVVTPASDWRGPVRTVLAAQPVRSCVQNVVSRQPVRSCARRAVSVRPLQRLFGGFRRCR